MTTLGTASLVAVLILEDAARLNAYERGWISQCELADGRIPLLNKMHGHL